MTRNLFLPQAATQDEPGPVGNSMLTSSTGLVLTVLLLIEGFTILDVRGYITLHTVLGLMLIGPVVLKSASTLYRFGRYYTGRSEYVRRGAPPLVLRLIGPFVVLSTVAVLATGIVLLSDHGDSGAWITAHQASFIVWISFTGLHFLGHVLEAARDTARDLSGRSGTSRRSRSLRLLAVVCSLAVGIGIAAAFTPSAASWQLHHGFHGQFHRRG